MPEQCLISVTTNVILAAIERIDFNVVIYFLEITQKQLNVLLPCATLSGCGSKCFQEDVGPVLMKSFEENICGIDSYSYQHFCVYYFVMHGTSLSANCFVTTNVINSTPNSTLKHVSENILGVN